MRGNVLVVGGYGGVGRFVSTTLGEQFPGQIIVAGRSYQKAQDLSQKTDGKLLPARLDISNQIEVGSTLDDNVGTVVMCVENQDSSFAEQCVARGIDYVDISATYQLLSRIEQLDSVAREHGSTILLSVGIAPGLTNLLASHCTSVLPELHNIDIFILLGMGEAHGESSIQWTLDNLNASYMVRQAGTEKHVQTFGDYKQTVFSGVAGERTAFRFNFSDQHTLVKTMGLESASTWLCLDSAFFTWLFYLQKKLGLLKLLKQPLVHRIYLEMLQNFRIGSDEFIAQVTAEGLRNGEAASYTCSVRGNGEAHVTGLVAAKAAACLHTSPTPPGVFHIEQLIEQPADFIKELSAQTEDFTYRL